MNQEKPEFVPFPKMSRLSRECRVSEKIDGTNSSIHITDYGDILYGSRNRWITPEDDNYGFARWAEGNKSDLLQLGPGTHFGEWWGAGVQRKYGMKEKRFSLFNTIRWLDKHGTNGNELAEKQEFVPECCYVVPEIYKGVFDMAAVEAAILTLKQIGSMAAPSFPDPEGVVVFHVAAGVGFKKTLKNDESPKSLVK